jgi:hypothetical protein
MAITEARVRKYLDPEEPNYSVAAAELGAEALPVLEALVQGADPLLASKAAYLASLIPDAESDRVIEQAARSEHPTVRVAAAAGLRSRPDAAIETAAELIADPDAGVRKVAAKSTRGRAIPAARREGPEDAPPDRDRSRPSAGGAAGKRVQVLEGEHGGGFPPGTTGDAERAGGQGGGDAGNTIARSAYEAAGTDVESGGGGDVGQRGAAGVSRAGDGPDGGGQIEGAGRDAGASQYGGGGA